MKFLIDLLPVILFFGSFTWAKKNIGAAGSFANDYLSWCVSGTAIDEASVPILVATAIAIVASFLQIAWLLIRRQKIEPMLWISVAIIAIFGGATIYFASEQFIKWKPTVLYWLFAAGLLVARLIGKNLIRSMMESKVTLPDAVWSRVNDAWCAFFAVMGVLNLYVAFWGGFETSTWVSFKLFGTMGLMLLFIIGQSIYMSRHMIKKGPEEGDTDGKPDKMP